MERNKFDPIKSKRAQQDKIQRKKYPRTWSRLEIDNDRLTHERNYATAKAQEFLEIIRDALEELREKEQDNKRLQEASSTFGWKFSELEESFRELQAKYNSQIVDFSELQAKYNTQIIDNKALKTEMKLMTEGKNERETLLKQLDEQAMELGSELFEDKQMKNDVGTVVDKEEISCNGAENVEKLLKEHVVEIDQINKERISKLEKDLLKITRKYDDLLSEHEELINDRKLDEANSIIEKLQNDRDIVLRRYEDLKKENQSLKSNIGVQKKPVECAKCNDLTNQINQIKGNLAALKVKLEEKTESWGEKKRETEEKLKNVKIELEKSKAENKKLVEVCKRLKIALRKLQDGSTGIETEKDESNILVETDEQIENLNVEAEIEVKAMKCEKCNDLTNQMVEIKDYLSTLKVKFGERSASWDEVKRDTEKKLSKLEIELETSKAEKEKLAELCEILKQDLSKVQDCENKRSESWDEVKRDTEKKLSNLEIELETSKAEKEKLVELCDRLKIDLSKVQDCENCAIMKLENESMKDKLKRMRARFLELKEQMKAD